jgi:hypothetical protein
MNETIVIALIEPEITIGNLIQIAMIIGGGIAAFVTLKAKQNQLDTRQDSHSSKIDKASTLQMETTIQQAKTSALLDNVSKTLDYHHDRIALLEQKE